MFRVVDAYEFERPVKVQVPGSEEVQDFIAKFRVSSEDIDALADPARIRETLLRVWTGWSGVVGEDGEEVPCTTELKERLLAFPFVRRAVLTALLDALAGGSRGNSFAA